MLKSLQQSQILLLFISPNVAKLSKIFSDSAFSIFGNLPDDKLVNNFMLEKDPRYPLEIERFFLAVVENTHEDDP